MIDLTHMGIVIIGRNEGDRLMRCLGSLATQSKQIVYVDSASSDDSVKLARSMGVEVVSLDMALPFTAARARNAGYANMRALYPHTEYVQFVDGDCEVASGWLASASRFLALHRDVAVVCGRRRERYPGLSIYNRLCDSEWDTPVGETKACGGDALIRVTAFAASGGFRSELIAGEEPELCVRLRAAGWKIWRLQQEMTLHDAAMTRFGQWWRRSRRGGYAFAEGAQLHGAAPERHWVRESRRSLLWGAGIPLLSFSLIAWLGAWGIVLLLLYPAQVMRLALRGTRPLRERWWHALFLVLGKFPEALGHLNFIYDRLAGKTARLIEYK